MGKASYEGQGPPRAVELMMMIVNIKNITDYFRHIYILITAKS
jgi:hypothetical protein